jgi:diguanylate cyclase (GGDEF)-like protein
MNQQILVIDDSEKIHPLIKAILAREPADIHGAFDPGHGLVLASSIIPDLVLLDVDMPGMNGFEVCKLLKANPQTADCPVIFLTSHSQANEKVHGFELGAMDYVTKPFNHAELLARVRASLKNSRAIRTLESQARIDPLTGLGNRATFVQRMASEICLRVRSKTPLSIVLLDLDDLIKIVDSYGQSVGDQVLATTGATLHKLCRLEDIACHFGDGEFGIIAPNTSGQHAFTFAERIRSALSFSVIRPNGVPVSVLVPQSVRVTGSFGVADALHPFDRSMIERAGDALCHARLHGGNRVSMAQSTDEQKAIAA